MQEGDSSNGDKEMDFADPIGSNGEDKYNEGTPSQDESESNEEDSSGAVPAVVIDKDELENSEGWVGWKVRIEKTLSGIEQEVGREFNVGWDEKYSHYSPVEFYDYEESEHSEG